MWYRILFEALCGSMVEYEMVHAKATYASCCRAEWRLERKTIGISSVSLQKEASEGEALFLILRLADTCDS